MPSSSNAFSHNSCSPINKVQTNRSNIGNTISGNSNLVNNVAIKSSLKSLGSRKSSEDKSHSEIMLSFVSKNPHNYVTAKKKKYFQSSLQQIIFFKVYISLLLFFFEILKIKITPSSRHLVIPSRDIRSEDKAPVGCRGIFRVLPLKALRNKKWSKPLVPSRSASNRIA